MSCHLSMLFSSLRDQAWQGDASYMSFGPGESVSVHVGSDVLELAMPLVLHLVDDYVVCTSTSDTRLAGAFDGFCGDKRSQW
jgi:hypothetical protein